MSCGAKVFFMDEKPCEVYKKSSPPELEVSDVNHPNIRYIYNDKHPECHTLVPTVDDLLDKVPTARRFAPFNEVEYSANIKFKNVKFIKSKYVYEKERFYINDTIKLFQNQHYASTVYFDNSIEVDGDIYIRFDYIPEFNGTDVVTSKLKVAKSKFNYYGVTYSLTAAIEIEFPELNSAMKTLPKPSSYSRRRQFIYWTVTLMVDSLIYKFRVAFRQLKNDDNYECNIECEDPISGSDFIECFDLLSKYYKRQYILQDKVISPVVSMDCKLIKLTARQITIAETIRLVDDNYQNSIPNDLQPNEDMVNLLKFMSLKAVNRYMDTGLPVEDYASIAAEYNPNVVPDDLDETSTDDMFRV